LSEEDWVLDVGCGAAENYQARVKSMVRSLSCIDLSSVAVEQARKQGFDASQHDFGNKFKFSDNTYDRAICLEVLEHLFDPLYCVREIYRVLKPGGKLVASVPNSGYFRWRLGMLFRLDLPFSGSDFANPWRADHIRFFDQKSFARLFEVAGFEIETIKSNGDTSIYDFLSILGAPGRFLAGLIRNWVTPLLRLAFLGDLFPGLFAPHLIVTVRKQVKIKEVM
jgi:SAM-dependent methyltransferase